MQAVTLRVLMSNGEISTRKLLWLCGGTSALYSTRGASDGSALRCPVEAEGSDKTGSTTWDRHGCLTKMGCQCWSSELQLEELSSEDLWYSENVES